MSVTITITRVVVLWPFSSLRISCRAARLFLRFAGERRLTIGIDGPPEPVFLFPDGNHHLIKIPSVGELTVGSLTKLMGEFETGLRRSFRHSLERNLNAALGKQVFNAAQAETNNKATPHAR